ncbi:hypothetical protein Tco_0495672 [Tanacetum coccineum]
MTRRPIAVLFPARQLTRVDSSVFSPNHDSILSHVCNQYVSELNEAPVRFSTNLIPWESVIPYPSSSEDPERYLTHRRWVVGASGLVGESMKGGGNGREWEVAAASALIRIVMAWNSNLAVIPIYKGSGGVAADSSVSQGSVSLPMGSSGKANKIRRVGRSWVLLLRLLVNLNIHLVILISSSSA